MRIREKRWFRWVLPLAALWIIIVGTLTTIGALSVIGHHRLTDAHSHTGEARRIAETITVGGFTRTAIADMNDGDRPPSAHAYFIGPAPEPDPLTIVSVPTIQLSAMDSDSADYARKHPDFDLPRAGGRRTDGCGAYVNFISKPTATVHDTVHHQWLPIFTDEQLAAVRHHTVVAMELTVTGCGW